MRFMFVCGGTAGHINPAIAIASEILGRKPESKILFVGADRDMEKRLIPRAGFDLVNIKMSGLARGITPDKLFKNAKTVRNLFLAGKEAGKIIGSFAPDAVVGTGGYICYPVLGRAARMGIPTYIHESNAVPGLTTKMLNASVKNVFVAFPGLEGLYRHPGRVMFTGTPVRGDFRLAKADNEVAEPSKKPLVLSFWGSLGAEKMNEAMAEFITLNAEEGRFDHIHATGKSGGVQRMMERLKQLGLRDGLPPGIQIREYIDDMPAVMGKADIVLCRAGGSTLAELTAMRKPSILIPSPYVTNDQQTKNAAQLEKAGGAVMKTEKDCSGKSLYTAVTSLLDDDERLGRMTVSLRELSVYDAETKIADVIFEGLS